VHGAIDGHTRLCPYLVAATDNIALTAFAAFLQGVEAYGAPRRVRVDGGGENLLLCRYVCYLRGSDAAFSGRSVHNQRIERFWRDVFREVACVFYDLLSQLEVRGLLNVNDCVQLQRLHFLILPILNAALNDFRNSWNVHGIRTEHHRSPN
jgi:hypothetical protein